MNYDPAFLSVMTAQGDMSYFMPLLHRIVLDRFSHEPGSIAELGVRGGNSTISFLAALVELGNDSRLYSCDKEPCDLRRVITPAMAYYWHFTQCDSAEFAARYDSITQQRPKLLFVDTEHTRDQCLRELIAWEPVLAKPARILLHDTLTTSGVAQAIAEFRTQRPNTRFYNIDVCHGLGVMDID